MCFVFCFFISSFSGAVVAAEVQGEGISFFSTAGDAFMEGFQEGKEEQMLSAKFKNATIELLGCKTPVTIFMYSVGHLPSSFEEMEVSVDPSRLRSSESIVLGADGAIVGVLPEAFGADRYLSLKPELDDDMQIVAWTLLSNVDPAIAKGATFVE